MSFALLEDYDKGDDLDAIARDFETFRALGIRTWRGSFGWDDYEPQRGRYDFTWLRRFVELAVKHDIVLRPYVAYTPEWAARGGRDKDAWNDPPRRLGDWTAFVTALSAALRAYSAVASFEIYNEENVAPWWDGDPAAYARVLAAGSRAVSAANPRAQIFFGGLVFPDADWVEQVCARADARRFDVLPVHAYPETWTPPGVTVESYLGDLSRFGSAADRACGRKAI